MNSIVPFSPAQARRRHAAQRRCDGVATPRTPVSLPSPAGVQVAKSARAPACFRRRRPGYQRRCSRSCRRTTCGSSPSPVTDKPHPGRGRPWCRGSQDPPARLVMLVSAVVQRRIAMRFHQAPTLRAVPPLLPAAPRRGAGSPAGRRSTRCTRRHRHLPLANPAFTASRPNVLIVVDNRNGSCELGPRTPGSPSPLGQQVMQRRQEIRSSPSPRTARSSIPELQRLASVSSPGTGGGNNNWHRGAAATSATASGR